MPAVPESATIACGRCKSPLPQDLFNRTEMSACPNCGTSLRVLTFPALHRRRSDTVQAEAVVAEGEAGCFFHPAKKAVVACGNCGRFICALCDLELKGQHLCPTCLESGKQKGKLAGIDNQRTIYPGIALSLALVSTLFWPVSLITAPITLFIVFWYRKAPGSLVTGAGKGRRIAAATLAVLQLIGWTILFIAQFL
jgi:uncharacterized CHY-type Zn-finger protein